jgi:hypothetical protein
MIWNVMTTIPALRMYAAVARAFSFRYAAMMMISARSIIVRPASAISLL